MAVISSRPIAVQVNGRVAAGAGACSSAMRRPVFELKSTNFRRRRSSNAPTRL